MSRYIAFAFDDESQGGALDIVGTSPDLMVAAEIAMATAKGLGNAQLWHVLDPQTKTVYHGNIEEPEDWLDEVSGMTYRLHPASIDGAIEAVLDRVASLKTLMV